jgi:ABC-type polar amino acid transport system ATPase subunit
MLLVTHEIHFAAEVADRIVFMDAGRVVEQGEPERVLSRPASDRLQVFLKRVSRHRTSEVQI